MINITINLPFYKRRFKNKDDLFPINQVINKKFSEQSEPFFCRLLEESAENWLVLRPKAFAVYLNERWIRFVLNWDLPPSSESVSGFAGKLPKREWQMSRNT
jgi:hypothetical protein